MQVCAVCSCVLCAGVCCVQVCAVCYVKVCGVCVVCRCELCAGVCCMKVCAMCRCVLCADVRCVQMCSVCRCVLCEGVFCVKVCCQRHLTSVVKMGHCFLVHKQVHLFSTRDVVHPSLLRRTEVFISCCGRSVICFLFAVFPPLPRHSCPATE